MEQNPDIEVIGVTNSHDGEPDERERFVRGMDVTIPHVLERSDDLWMQYGVTSQPSMVFVNADGTFERHVGFVNPVDLLALATDHLSHHAS